MYQFLERRLHGACRWMLAVVDYGWRYGTRLFGSADLCHMVYVPPRVALKLPWLPFVLRVDNARRKITLDLADELVADEGVWASLRFVDGVLSTVVTKSTYKGGRTEGKELDEMRPLKFLFAEAGGLPCSKALRNVHTLVPLRAFDVVALTGSTGSQIMLVDENFERHHYLGVEQVIAT